MITSQHLAVKPNRHSQVQGKYSYIRSPVSDSCNRAPSRWAEERGHVDAISLQTELASENQRAIAV